MNNVGVKEIPLSYSFPLITPLKILLSSYNFILATLKCDVINKSLSSPDHLTLSLALQWKPLVPRQRIWSEVSTKSRREITARTACVAPGWGWAVWWWWYHDDDTDLKGGLHDYLALAWWICQVSGSNAVLGLRNLIRRIKQVVSTFGIHVHDIISELVAKVNIYNNILILQSLRLSEQPIIRRGFLMSIEPESGELDELKVYLPPSHL